MPICTKPLEYLEDTRSPNSTTTTSTVTVAELYDADEATSSCHHHRISPTPGTMKPLTNHETNNNDDDNQVEDDEEDEELAICGDCGRVLGPGWQCSSCRRSCPHCNRALTTDPDDYCGRCFRKCIKHGIVYSLISGDGCPKCSKSTMTSRPSR